MNPTVRLARLVLSDPDRARSEAQRIDDASKAKRKRVLERSRPRRAEEKAETDKGRAHQAKVYAVVDARAGGQCELADQIRCEAYATDHDHFWGRGKAKETPENVWHLCRHHHQLKTDNKPARSFWLYWFRLHCIRHGFRSEEMKTDRAIALENAQHPDHEEDRTP